MKLRTRVFKVAAFIPAIVLVGGFVGCHAGMFQRFSNPESQQPTAPQATSTLAPEKPPLFMSGTKSISNKGLTTGLTPAGPSTEAPPTEEKPPTFMNGTKSLGGLGIGRKPNLLPNPMPTAPNP